MCNIYDWSEISPTFGVNDLKNKKIIDVALGERLEMMLDDGSILAVKIENGTADDLDGKPSQWLVVTLNGKEVTRKRSV